MGKTRDLFRIHVNVWQSSWYVVGQKVLNKSLWSKELMSNLGDRFKGLELIDRVPDELWTEVHDTVQENGARSSPRKRNAKKKNGCLRRPYK